MSSASQNLQVALTLAEEHALPVFPCRADKRPYTQHGFLDATRSIEQIAAMWEIDPDALIGVPTGPTSKLFAIDIDPDGAQWYREHAHELGAGRIHRTRRGYHLLYRMPTMEIRNSAGKIATGVDVRGEGGYIIWWPAQGLEATGDLADIGEPPAWLLELLASRPNGHDRDIALAICAGGKQRPGNRNSTLTRLAGSMRRAGFSGAAISDALHKENYQRFDPPLPAEEVNRICQQAEKWQQGETPAVPCAAIDWTTLTGPPPPRIWWIPDWLSADPALTSGGGGVGKTTLWRAAGTALATGKRYLTDPVAPLKVLMWLCEDTIAEVHRQQAVVNDYFGITMADLKDRLYVEARQGYDNTLLEVMYGKPTFTGLMLELHERVNDLNIDVLVLDNLRQVFGGQEQDGHQATYFVNGIAGMVRERPFAPVLLGHVARSPGSEFSGNAAWENAVRMRWYLGPTLPDQKPDEGEVIDPDVLYLAKRKANYTAKDYQRLRYRNGLFVPDAPEGRRFDQCYRDKAAEDVVLEAMPKLTKAGLAPTDAKNANDYLPTQIVAKGYGQGYSKKELTSAMHRLMGGGRLRRDVIGKYSNRTPKHGLVIP